MKYTLITGASSGIGYEFAKVCAEHKENLILVARSKQKLTQLADQLTKEHKVTVHVLSGDLSQPDAAQNIHSLCKKNKRTVETLVNNAGFGVSGFFPKTDIGDTLNMNEVNIQALTEMTHLFLADMHQHKRGKILQVASTAAFQPLPYMAAYGANKAYVVSFSQALQYELKDSKISVSILCPGATKTPFIERANMTKSKLFDRSMTADAVARIAYRGLLKEKKLIIPGMMNKVLYLLTKCMPLRFKLRVTAYLVKH